MNCYINESNVITTKISDKRDEDALASAVYKKSYEKIGWDYLSIATYEKNDKKYNDSSKAYAMGFLEGTLTNERIYSHYKNFHNYFLSEYDSNPQIFQFFENFVFQILEYLREKSTENMDKDPFWQFAHYMYQQIKGLHEGYNISYISQSEKQLSLAQIYMLAASSDMQDIGSYLFRQLPHFQQMTPEELERYETLNSHCSAFVKLAKDYSDIYFGHNTWTFYSMMIRIFKEYRFVTNKGNEKAKTVAFSSYPGGLASSDEFHIMDSNIASMGTSLNILKQELYDLISYESLGSGIRIMIANRLASSAEEWTKIFQRENSGTCNEQAIILDMNKIDLKNTKIEDKALMIIEQMPNYTETVDVTDHLRNGYWPSYNVPFVDKIYKDMGNQVEKISEGVYENVGYTRAPRAKIFKRDQGKVNSKEEFKKFMRYNDYKNDNLSENDPSKTIASRYDLGDSKDTYCGGAIDSKFISVKEMLDKKNIIYIISGPSNDQQDSFSWLNQTCKADKDKISYIGQNNVWNFPWIEYNIQLFNGISGTSEEPKSNLYWIIGVVVGVVLIVVIIVVIVYLKKKRSKDDDESELLKDNNKEYELK